MKRGCEVCGTIFQSMASAAKFCGLKCKFLSHFEQTGEGPCWEWGSPRNKAGYGVLGLPTKRNVLAHRYSFQHFRGPITDGLNVLHKCDNPPCVNPSHLFLGTHKDNSHDCVRKGRNSPPPVQRGIDNILVRCPELRPMGEDHHSARLTEEQVIEIFNSRGPLLDVCQKFNIGKSHASMIRRALIWKHILAPHLVGKNTR